MRTSSKVFFLFFLLLASGYSQESEYRIVEISVSDSFPMPHLNQLQAADSLRKRLYVAIAERNGIFIGKDALRNIDHTQRFFHIESRAEILKVTDFRHEFFLVSGVTHIRGSLTAQVKFWEANPDLSFQANLSGLKNSYGTDEFISFSVNATQDCYLYVLNLFSLDSAIVLIPNKLLTDNIYQTASAQQRYQSQIVEQYIQFRPSVPPGKNSVREDLILAVIKKEFHKYPFTPTPDSYRLSDPAGNAFIRFDDFIRYMSTYSPDQKHIRYYPVEIFRSK